MNISSYYMRAQPEEHFQFWDYGIGRDLPERIGVIKNSEVKFQVIGDGNYKTLGNEDLAYCQLFSIPNPRPSKFVYTFLSDYIGNEPFLNSWISQVRPNLICCLQHVPEDLIEYANRYECKVKLTPWFVTQSFENEEKTITGMCSGCIDPNIYGSRKKIYDYLTRLNRKDILLSCSEQFGKYPLSNNQYSGLIKKTKYYLSGGIYDRFVPPKYYEVANHGACIVTFDMGYLSKVGFENMETCVVIKRLEEIPEILDSDIYRKIGENARNMIRQKHTTEKRAEEIVKIYNESFLK